MKSQIVIITALILISIVPLCAEGARADDGAQAGAGLYATAGTSLVYMEMPSYAPVWERTGYIDGGAQRLPSLLGDHLKTPMFSLSVGKLLDHGQFLEARTEYAHSTQTVEGAYRGTAAYPRIGVFGIEPEKMIAMGTLGTAYTDLDFSFRRQGASLLAGRTYVHGLAHITPFFGPWFMQLHQDYHLRFSSSTVMRVTLNDEVRTSYYGLLAGLRMSRQTALGGLSLEITAGPAFARSHYQSAQDVPSNTSIPHMSIEERHDRLALKSNMQLSLDVPVGAGFSVGLSAGSEYLSYMPEVVSSGANNQEHYDDAAHLEGISSFAGLLSLALSYTF